MSSNFKLPRQARKRGRSTAKRGFSAEQIPILIDSDHPTELTDEVLRDLGDFFEIKVLNSDVAQDTVICTNVWKGLQVILKAGKHHAYPFNRG